MRLPIRYQLLLPLLTLLLGVVVLTTWIAWSAAERARQRIEKQLDSVAESISSVTFPRTNRMLKLMKGLSGADFLMCDGRRRPVSDAEGQPLATLPNLPSELPEPGQRDRWRLSPRVRVGEDVYFCQGVALQPEVDADRIVYVFYPEAAWRETVTQAVRPALIAGGTGAAVAIVLTLVVTRHINRRVGELVRRTRLIAAGDFSPMPLPHRRDELHDLGEAVNDMAQRLATYQESLKVSERLRLLGQLSGGLAHQLRNGVAGAKLALQLYSRSAPPAEEIAVALRQLVLVELHLKRFLDLGKTAELHREPCDLGSIVADTAALVKPHCHHTGIQLEWRPPPGPVTIVGDAHHLGQVVLNLLSNAIDAAGPGGRVEVRVVPADAGGPALEVLDSGPGIEPGLADRLFEPFVTGKPEGVGLGLAVARQIVAAHGGKIHWSRRADTTCFRVDLPGGPSVDLPAAAGTVRNS
ncbi:MAG: HAMP domain-containing histidine kinase [Gemmataceae bacterium]|nr:HAMP domain-containing histidine kinase [Gemmataceae bacterium]